MLNGKEVTPPENKGLIQCTGCCEFKNPEAFSVDLRRVNGRFSKCRECDNYRGKQRKAERKKSTEDFKFQ